MDELFWLICDWIVEYKPDNLNSNKLKILSLKLGQKELSFHINLQNERIANKASNDQIRLLLSSQY